MTYNMKELDVLARTAYGEARNQGNIGMAAVALVVINRVKADLNNDGKPDWWGEGIIGVCKKPYQFSCWNEGDPNKALIQSDSIRDDRVFHRAMVVCEMVLEEVVFDITYGATHYHTIGIRKVPDWVKGARQVARIKDHVFYRGVK